MSDTDQTAPELNRDLQSFNDLVTASATEEDDAVEGDVLDSVIETMRERNISFAAACKRITKGIQKEDEAEVRATERAAVKAERQRVAKIERLKQAQAKAAQELAELTGASE